MIHVWLVNQQGNLRVFNEGAMSATLGSDADSTSAWLAIDSLQALGDLPFLKATDKQVCLYLTTQSFLSLSSNLSNVQLKQLGNSGQQYLFEDIALTPVEQLSVKHWTDKHISSERYFYALPETVIERWQKSVELAGFNLSAILPDFLLLPVASSLETIQTELSYKATNKLSKKIKSKKLKAKDRLGADGSTQSANDTNNLKIAAVFHDVEYDRYIIRQSEVYGTALSHFSLIPRILSDVDEVIFIENDYSSYIDSSYVDDEVDSGLSLQKHPAKIAFKDLLSAQKLKVIESRQTLLPVTLPVRHLLNFASSKNNQYLSPYLAIAISVALLAGTVQILADAYEGHRYKQAAIATQAATNQQFANWFNGQDINQREALESQIAPFLLDDNVEGTTSLALLNQVTRLIKQAGGSTTITAQAIDLSEDTLQMVLQSPRRDVIDELTQSLNSQGMTANLESVNTQPQGDVVATIALTLPSSNDDL